jgi:hypothetical protein
MPGRLEGKVRVITGISGIREPQERWNRRRRPHRAGDGTARAPGLPLGRDRSVTGLATWPAW